MLHDLVHIRQEAALFMPQLAEVWTRSATTGEYGEPADEWSKVADGVPCRVIKSSGSPGGLESRNGRDIRLERYSIVMPHNTDIPRPGRLVIDGIAYDVDEAETKWTDAVTIRLEVFRT